MTTELTDKKVLVVDDDAMLREIVQFAFARAGAQVYQATGGHEALRQFYARQPDLMILDLMMPDLDGWEVCHQIRQVAQTPIIMLTAVSLEDQMIRGLDCGADDFLVKPTNPELLLARARAVIRRADRPNSTKKATSFSDGYLTLDLDKYRILVMGEPVKLTPTEFRLLAYLVDNAGRVLTFRQILTHVWGDLYQDSVEYVHVHVSSLRKKLEPEPKQPRYLLSEYGVGYRFEK